MPRGRTNSGALGARCTICAHAARPQIDLSIATGLSKRHIAQRFRVSPDAVWRHGKEHLSPELKTALALKLLVKEGDTRAVLLEEGAGAVEALRAIRAPMFGLFLQAIEIGDSRSVAALAGRLHEGLTLSARLTGQLVPAAGTTIQNIVLSADYIALRSSLLAALRPFPEAARAVAEVFRTTGEHAAAEMHQSVPRPMMIEAQATEVEHAA
jgi:hypothetical protein